MRKERKLSAFIFQLAVGSAFATLINIPRLVTGDLEAYYPAMLIAFAPLLYAVLAFFLRKERPMGSVVIFCAAACVLATLSIGFMNVRTGLGFTDNLIYRAVVCAIISYVAYKLCVEGMSDYLYMLFLDAAAIILVLGVGLGFAYEAAVAYCVFPIICFAAAVASAVSLRFSDNAGPREYAVLGLAFAAVILPVGLMVRLLAGSLGKGAIAFGKAFFEFVKNALFAIGAAIQRFFLMLGARDMDVYVPEPQEGGGMEMDLEAMGEARNLEVLYAIALILVALAILTFVLLKFRGRRTAKTAKAVKGNTVVSRKRAGLIFGLRKAGGKIAARLAFLALMKRERRYAMGLYLWLAERYKTSKKRQRDGETPREFILRLAGETDDAELGEALRALAEEVDREAYAPRYERGTFASAKYIKKHSLI